MASTTHSGPGGGVKVVGYIRVSTDRQAVIGSSLEAQTAAITAECEARGWELLHAHQDAQTGKNTQRPGLQAARLRVGELARNGEAAALMVARIDRLSRRPIDVYDIMDEALRGDWSLVCLDPAIFDMTTPFGRAIAGVAAVFAQLERELGAQRTREGIAAKKANGTYRGGRALPQAAPVSPDVTERIMHHADNDMSAEAIARMLDVLDVPTPRGGPSWSGRTVRAVIARERAPRTV